ncbi:hypothetical protein VTN96DRAFT_9809 [Rasamsonia emersonii]
MLDLSASGLCPRLASRRVQDLAVKIASNAGTDETGLDSVPSCRRLQRYSTVREVNFEEVFILHPDARKILGHGRPVRLAPSPTFHDDMDSMQLHSLASGQLLLIGSLPDYYLPSLE